MNAHEKGLFIPRRVIFILIPVSIFINIFFLLMGILIGKDDVKWQQQGLPEEVLSADPLPETQADALDMELSVFDRESQERRPEPIGSDYLNEETPPAKVADKPRKTETPARKPPPKKETPVQTGSSDLAPIVISEGYWVQVLAIDERAKAAAFRSKVVSKGFAAVMVAEAGFYKVRVGPFVSRQAAETEKKRLKSVFKVDGWILKK